MVGHGGQNGLFRSFSLERICPPIFDYGWTPPPKPTIPPAGGLPAEQNMDPDIDAPPVKKYTSEYASLMATVVSGLLASGHFTTEASYSCSGVDQVCRPYGTSKSGSSFCVTEAAAAILTDIFGTVRRYTDKDH
jgi:hypothetical protein